MNSAQQSRITTSQYASHLSRAATYLAHLMSINTRHIMRILRILLTSVGIALLCTCVVLAADDDIDSIAQNGAQYDDANLPPPSQNPNLASNANNANANNENTPMDSHAFTPQESNLLPHQYPLTDRLTSPDIPTAQVKAAMEAMKNNDVTNAFSLFKQACDAGNPAGCFGLGSMYATGRGVDVNLEQAQRYYELGCGAGDPTSCTNLAMLYNEKTNATNEDKELAVQFYMTACQGGDAIACNNLGHMYANGDGVNKDFFKAINYYKLSCNGGSNLGCYNLGLISNTENLYGKNKHALSTADLNYVACNAGDIKGCANLGYMYANGLENVPVSYAYAAKYFKMACDVADIPSCNNLGVLYQKGLGVTQNTSYALDLYAYACNAGLQQGCDNYRIFKQDLQINPNPTYTTKPTPPRTSLFYKR